MNDFWQRRILIAAAAWNLIGGGSAVLDPAKHVAQLYTASLALGDPLQRFFFHCTWINVIAWGLAYLLAAFRPAARAPVLIAGGIGKLVYFAACWALVATGVGKMGVLIAGFVDLALAALFLVAAFAPRGKRVEVSMG